MDTYNRVVMPDPVQPTTPPASMPVQVPSPVPQTPVASDPVSGAVIQQVSQDVEQQQQPGAVSMSGAGAAVPTAAGKEGLPVSTEIPVTAAAGLESGNTAPPESAPQGGPAEVEPAKELEPEVQELQEKISEQKIAGAKETVIKAATMPSTVPNTAAQPVVVLPLTEQGMSDSKNKNTTNSARWLYEWCVRQIRKFTDILVVYRDDKE